MSRKTFDLKEMTVDDLFRAKEERRHRLASLTFEEKIEIVKKLQAVSRKARADRRDALGESRAEPETEG